MRVKILLLCGVFSLMLNSNSFASTIETLKEDTGESIIPKLAKFHIEDVAQELINIETAATKGQVIKGRYYVKRRLPAEEALRMWTFLTSDNSEDSFFSYHGGHVQTKAKFSDVLPVPDDYMRSNGKGRVWLRSVPNVPRENIPPAYTSVFAFIPDGASSADFTPLMFAVHFFEGKFAE